MTDPAQLTLFDPTPAASPGLAAPAAAPTPPDPTPEPASGSQPSSATSPGPPSEAADVEGGAARCRRSPIEAATSRDPEERALYDRLQELLDGRLRSLVLTDNRRSILYIRPADATSGHRRDPDGLAVRLHRAFVGAPDDVLGAVAQLIEGEADAEVLTRCRKILRRWTERFWNENGAPKRRLVLHPVGRTVDLREIRDDINRRFFDGQVSVLIAWSRVLPGTVCRRRSIRLGSYQEETNVVRVHPALDHPDVPRYVVESIVYHEMLHADLPAVVKNGRRHVHTPEFRRRERQFPDYRRAKSWIRRNLKRLLRY